MGCSCCAECGNKTLEPCKPPWHLCSVPTHLRGRLATQLKAAQPCGMRHREQSQTSNGPCSSAGSKSHITPLQIYKFQPRTNGNTVIPVMAVGQESQLQLPILVQQWSHRWDLWQLILPSIYALTVGLGDS